MDIEDEQQLKDAVHEAEHEYCMALAPLEEAERVLEAAKQKLDEWFSEFG